MIRPRPVAYLLAFAALFSTEGTASAGLIPTTVSVSPDGGNFRWTYGVVLPTDMRLQNGNYFTIYDFAGLVPGTAVAPSGWHLTSNFVGTTPNLLGPLDNPSIPNLTFTYDGPTIPAGQVWLGSFSAESVFQYQAVGAFTATNPRSGDGIPDQNITQTFVPTGVPEPSAFVLLGIGLPLLPLLRRSRRCGPASACSP